MQHRLLLFLLTISFYTCSTIVDLKGYFKFSYTNNSNRLVEIKAYTIYGDSTYYKVNVGDTYIHEYETSYDESTNIDSFVTSSILGNYSVVIIFDSLKSISFKNHFNESFCANSNTCFSPYCIENYTSKYEGNRFQYFYEFKEEMYDCAD